MITALLPFRWRWFMITLALLFGHTGQHRAYGNPTTTTATVSQGTASFSSPSSSQLTITTSANAFINWQSFNIAAGETTTFIQPSSSSVVWNQINDPNPSQILGTLNANGYVVLQNQSGFYIGGSAAINTHGLVMTTAPSPMPNLSSGGAWQFNAPPPTAQIINYGQINIAGGGSAFLIASDIENRNDGTGTGTISAPGGKIGLYAGQQVLVSTSPDGRGLSASVTLPQGSVDNEGNLIANAGSIVAQAKTVNQGGLIQANSVQNINGVIELLASDSLTLGASSAIEAHGDNTSATVSPGGFVVLKSDKTFADTAGSTINVAGSTSAGGQDGIVEIFGNNVVDATSIQSIIDNNYALLINPHDITLSGNTTDTSSSNPNLNVNDLAAYSQIALFAKDNIELSAVWSLTDPGAVASLSLQSGNNLILDDGSGINAGNNWSVNLTAGTGFVPTVGQLTPVSGSDGIYLNGHAYIQTQNGDIDAWAANEILVSIGDSSQVNYNQVLNNGIRTLNGGNINVTTQYGDVNTGGNPMGYLFSKKSPYYSVAVDIGSGQVLGGISTAAGGNVTITSGGNVTSFLPLDSSQIFNSNKGETEDAGSGAFGPEPGNVTVTAGGSVFGHYVVANGTGNITANQNIGGEDASQQVALSLVKGSWNLNAPNGDIYLQEVRNPNAVFNNNGKSTSPGFHLFDYDLHDSVYLTAIGVYLIGGIDLPRPDQGAGAIYPPSLYIAAGKDGVTLEDSVTLFPSPYGNLEITTTDGGNLVGTPNTELLMSDSSKKQFNVAGAFGDTDHGSSPIELNNPNPVLINISGNIENLTLITDKETCINVVQNIINSGFSGENLHSSDTTYIKVGGQIYNQSAYTFDQLPQPIAQLPAADLPLGLANTWDAIFNIALNLSSPLLVPQNLDSSQWATYVQQYNLFPTLSGGNNNPGFVYLPGTTPGTKQLGFAGQMSTSISASVQTALINQQLTVLQYGANGIPLTYVGTDGKTYFKTGTVNWVDSSVITYLLSNSQGAPSTTDLPLGYRIGGPGQFDIQAQSIDLGNSCGILSCGVADPQGGFARYNNLASITPAGATVNVTVTADQTGTVVVDGYTIDPHASLDMLTSTIAALGGGDVNVTSTGGSLDLGSENLFGTRREVGFGVFTTGVANVNVIAEGDINIDGSRIAAYNGGNIFIESLDGNVNAGTGGTDYSGAEVTYVNPKTGQAGFYAEAVFGNGIVANTLVDPSQVPGSALIPGNITVETPRGDIYASLGGIVQEALNGNISGGPTISLIAGTKPSGTIGQPGYLPGYVGNIDLGQSGVIGGTVNATANGNITGLVISRQNSTIQAAQNFSGTVLSGGTASVSGGGTVSGTIIGVGGANVSGGAGVSAEVLGQNVSVNGGATQSTLGTTASASTAAQSAAQQSGNESKQLASNTDDSDDDKKHKPKPALSRHIKRVTVILPKAS